MIGIILNCFLFAVKFAAGILSKSVSITADAFNNLTDAGTVMISLLGLKIASIGGGKRHPYGHGRFEWITALVTAVFVFLVGWELFKTSIDSIRNPQTVIFTPLTAIILVVSIATKMYLYFYNSIRGKKENSLTLKAIATDSISDAISTTAVLVSLVINTIFGWQIDGWIGLAVSLVIIKNGIHTFSETAEMVMGKAATKESIEQLIKVIKTCCPKISEVLNPQIEDLGYNRFRAICTLQTTEQLSTEELACSIPVIRSTIKKELGYDSIIQIEKKAQNFDESIFKEKIKAILKSNGIDTVELKLRAIQAPNSKFQLFAKIGVPWMNKTELADKMDTLITNIKYYDCPELDSVVTQYELTRHQRKFKKCRHCQN